MSPAPPPRARLFFDGGCRPNPGAMETAVVFRGHAHVRTDLGRGTSMDAEWLALIDALRLVRDLRLAHVVLLGDAAAVIAQATGAVRCRDAYRHHLDAFRALAASGERAQVRYVQRAQNLAGIALARLHAR